VVFVNGRASGEVVLQPDGQPDWVYWELPELQPGAELSLRVEADKGVAAIGGLVLLSPQPGAARKNVQAGVLPVIDRKVGEFSREGEYVKDYYVFREGDTFHLFYNVGHAGETQQWFEAGNEKAVGHATSKDLKTWENHPRVLEAVPASWEGMVVSAPSIIKHDGTHYMFYTGFDDRVPGKQTVGLATSKDLFNWERHPGNPVYEAPEWAERRPDGWIDCRDSHVAKYGDEFLLFTMVTTKEGKGAIALASSKNLVDWEDLGPAVTTFKEPESPRVFEHDGKFYMFISSAHGRQLLRATNPKTGPWEEVPFRWPAPGLWSGWETVDEGDRTIFSAFEWKSFGNFIRFWEVKWKDGVPAVVY
jgi:beta-fructofuranosidase